MTSEPIEYTPSVDDVRRDYARQRNEHMHSPSPQRLREFRESGGGGAEFDRWLTAHDARIASEAAEAERARLLELAKTTPLSLRQVIERELTLENWATWANNLAAERKDRS